MHDRTTLESTSIKQLRAWIRDIKPMLNTVQRLDIDISTKEDMVEVVLWYGHKIGLKTPKAERVTR